MSRVLGLFVSYNSAMYAPGDFAGVGWVRRVVATYVAELGVDDTIVSDAETLGAVVGAPIACKFVGFCADGTMRVNGKLLGRQWRGRCRDGAIIAALEASRRGGHAVGALVLSVDPQQRDGEPDDTAAASILLQARNIYADSFDLGDPVDEITLATYPRQMFARVDQ